MIESNAAAGTLMFTWAGFPSSQLFMLTGDHVSLCVASLSTLVVSLFKQSGSKVSSWSRNIHPLNQFQIHLSSRGPRSSIPAVFSTRRKPTLHCEADMLTSQPPCRLEENSGAYLSGLFSLAELLMIGTWQLNRCYWNIIKCICVYSIYKRRGRGVSRLAK